MAYVIIALLLAGVVWLVSGPLRAARRGQAAEDALPAVALRRSDLEAARDAKYQEIRDAELDHETGKLSDEDYAAVDSTLRSEAIAVLHELDQLDSDALLERSSGGVDEPAPDG